MSALGKTFVLFGLGLEQLLCGQLWGVGWNRCWKHDIRGRKAGIHLHLHQLVILLLCSPLSQSPSIDFFATVWKSAELLPSFQKSSQDPSLPLLLITASLLQTQALSIHCFHPCFFLPSSSCGLLSPLNWPLRRFPMTWCHKLADPLLWPGRSACWRSLPS